MPEPRPRILFAAPYIPYVPSQGGLTRTFHLVRAASQVADVVLVGALPPYPQATLDDVRPLCAEVHVLPAPPGVLPKPFAATKDVAHDLGFRYGLGRPLALVADWARAVRHTQSAVRKVDQAPFTAKVSALLDDGSYDLLIVEHSHIAGMLQGVVATWRGTSIVDFHNVISLYEERVQATRLQRRRRQRPTTAELRMLAGFRALEQQVLRSFGGALATSRDDANYLRRLVPGVHVDIVPNGVDTTYFASSQQPFPATADESDVPTLIFTGTLAHPPNADALQFFLTQVMPLIRARQERVRFWIVGAGPVPRLVRMLARHEDVKIFESVDDVRPFFARSAVAVVPLRAGSGTRLKILEALTAGVPVVSTTLGAEGLDVENGRDVLIADEPRRFADAVLALLERPDFARELAGHGAARVRQSYSWDTIGAGFQSVLLQALATHPRGVVEAGSA